MKVIYEKEEIAEVPNYMAVGDTLIIDNEIYEIDNNAVGDDLVFNHIAQKVKVTGQIKSVSESGESDAYKVIKVESFEVVEE